MVGARLMTLKGIVLALVTVARVGYGELVESYISLSGSDGTMTRIRASNWKWRNVGGKVRQSRASSVPIALPEPAEFCLCLSVLAGDGHHLPQCGCHAPTSSTASLLWWDLVGSPAHDATSVCATPAAWHLLQSDG
ncbi:hypothetical protein RRF57_005701 [Xylaria bambusicola]|uniref:Secreted protein n=1 Tax=Xylaria bambusicola TaxID=326684 RepID=A0AAN7UP09_9PEZI